MNTDHRPTPEFVSNLEWQIRTSHKRGNRFSEPVTPKPGGKMKISVLVMASALVGAGGVVVKDGVQDLRAQEVLLTQVGGDLRLAELQLEIARTQLEEVERLHEVGAVEEQALLEARVQARQAEAEYLKLSLNEEEIRLSGKEPQNQLSAPLVAGRDFVTERLVLHEMVAYERLSAARIRHTRYQNLVQAGVILAEDLSEVSLALREIESQLSGINERITLRERFLDGLLAAEDAEREYEITQTQTRVDLLRQALNGAMVRFRGVEERVGMGLISEAELPKARLEVMQLETQLEFLEVKLMTLRGRTPSK
jgi:hypothetical protein